MLLDQLKNIPYISKQNLGLILGKKQQSLNYWVKKLIADKSLITLKKGLYISKYYYDIISSTENSEKEKYLIYLANNIRFPSYVSLEYVLSKNGFIVEVPFTITSITIKSTRDYVTDIGTFYYKNIKGDLFYGYDTTPFKDKQIREASLSKALFDFLYIKSFRNEVEIENYLTFSSRFNWGVFESKYKKEFIEIIKKSKSNKMQKILNVIQKYELI